MSRISVYLLVMILGVVTSRQPDPTLCTPSDGSNPGPTPTLPDSFTARIECNIITKNFTVSTMEWYDQPGNRGASVAYQYATRIQSIYDYNTGQYIMALESIDHQPMSCVVQAIANSSSKYLFGMTTSKDGKQHIGGVGGALRFGRTLKETYRGQTRVRGILVDKFESCTYMEEFSSSVQIFWYFTANNNWNTATAKNQVPVRCEIFGKRADKSTFHHIYDITSFVPGSIPVERFEVPRGLYCPGRNSAKSLPKIGSFFQYYAEFVIPERKSIGYIAESYDYTIRLVRYEYYPPPGSRYGTNRLVEVHDYNTGVAYIYDPMLGNCSAGRIEASIPDARMVDANHVRIRTSMEFFDFDHADYHYMGERIVRNIKCDVWTALRNDWPTPTSGFNSTFEWYFAQPQVTESIGYNRGESIVPVMLEVTVQTPKMQNVHFIYDFYDYSEDQPLIWTFDISPCFNYLHRKTFKFALPGKFKDVLLVNEVAFKYYLILTIQEATHISPLRIANILMDYSQDDLLVSFVLLDVAPKVGDIKAKVVEVPLAVAVSNLTSAIDSGAFTVSVIAPSLTKPLVMTAKKYTSSHQDVVVKNTPDTSSPSPGYSAGVVSGVALGLLLVTFLLGFLLLFLVYHIRGGTFRYSFKPDKFDDEIPVIT